MEEEVENAAWEKISVFAIRKHGNISWGIIYKTLNEGKQVNTYTS